MDSQQIVEWERAVDALAQDVDDWKLLARAGTGGFGIHHKQVEALRDMMEYYFDFMAELRRLLRSSLPADRLNPIFHQARSEYNRANDLWGIFRAILIQRRDPALLPTLDAADLIAASCYDRLERLVVQRRPPPLAYLVPAERIAIVLPDASLDSLPIYIPGSLLHHYSKQLLPIPVILLPTEHAANVWLYSAILHETGHNVLFDLPGTGNELRELVGESLKQVTRYHWDLWWNWLPEILADACGVLFGGAGFACAMTSLQDRLLPWPAEITGTGDYRQHPHPWLRIYLLAGMLARCKIRALDDASAQLLETWRRKPVPGGGDSLRQQAAVVLDVLFNRELKALHHQTLRALAPALAQEATRTTELAGYLIDLINGQRGQPPKRQQFPHRLVPGGAQLALAQLTQPTADHYTKLHAQALAYLHSLDRPRFLASSGQRALVRDLAARVIPYEQDNNDV